MSIYPTLAEANGLKIPGHVEGKSILKLLKNPNAEWDTPAMTTFKEGNHSVRSEKHRYIKYQKGGEEFYDEMKDLFEWNNLILNKNIAVDKGKLANFLPKINKKPVGNNGIKAVE